MRRSARRSSSPIGQRDERTRVRARLSQLRLQFQVDPAADYEELEAEGLAGGGTLRVERRRFRCGSRVARRLLGSLGPVPARAHAPGGRARLRARPPCAGSALSAGRPDRGTRHRSCWGRHRPRRRSRQGEEILERGPGPPRRRGLRAVLPRPDPRDARPARGSARDDPPRALPIGRSSATFPARR